MSKSVSIRLPDELVEQLENVARDTERSRSFIVQRAIEFYLEDYADLQVALDRLRDKSDRIVSSDELKKSLGL
jgi:RHH-type rel operon transcriptional repressor/antitoxin RelB